MCKSKTEKLGQQNKNKIKYFGDSFQFQFESIKYFHEIK